MKLILKLSIPSSIISGSNWENLILRFNTLYPYAYKKRMYSNEPTFQFIEI